MNPAAGGPGLGAKAARGAAVTFVGQGARIGVQVLSVVILARLLSPRDYGLVAMITAVIGVAEIFRDFGLSAAAIQSRTLTRGQRSNLFWINAAVGATLSALVFATAPLLAAAYGEPLLADVARGLAVIFLINGLATQHRADLSRSLRFGRLAVADVSAPVVGLAVGFAIASTGGGFWSLVGMQLAQALTLLVVVWAASWWMPGRPARGHEMRPLLSFGWNLAGSQLIGYVSNNIDSVLIGARFGASQLGLYNRAFQLLMTPLSQVRAPTTTVALPVLSSLQDDRARFSSFVARGQMALGCTIIAGLAVVVGGSEPITAVALGEQWDGVAPLLALLAVAGIFQTLAYVGYWVYLSTGRTRDLFRYTLLTAAIKIACVAVGSSWGVLGVAAGYALAPVLAWPLSFWWLSRRDVVDVAALFRGAGRILTLCVFVGGGSAVVATILRGEPDALGLVGSLAGGGAGYGICVLLVPPLRRDVLDVLAMGRTGLRRAR